MGTKVRYGKDGSWHLVAPDEIVTDSESSFSRSGFYTMDRVEPLSPDYFLAAIAMDIWRIERAPVGDPNRETVIFERALSIGQHLRELQLRDIALPAATTGLKTRKGGAKGHVKTYGTPEAKAARWAVMAAEVRELIARGTPKMAAYSLIAEKHGVDERTIRRHLDA